MILVLPPEHGLQHWLTHYGSLGLFLLLSLGIIGLPIPDETLLILAGVLSAKGHLNLYSAYTSALLGAICGITVSYLLGYYAGKEMLKRFGYLVGLTETRLEGIHSWFDHYGKWLLCLGYFIPGVRHFSGLVVGSVYLSYPQFALFAYIGALCWTICFFCIGYFFFDAWNQLHLYNYFT